MELIVNAIDEMMIMLSKESAIVGPEVSGFNASIISGSVKIKAKIARVKVSLLPIVSLELSKMKIEPRRKNMAIKGIVNIATE